MVYQAGPGQRRVRTAFACAVVTLCLGGSFRAWSSDAEPPKYLQLAREFVANTKPEDNTYILGKSFTRMPGDLLARSYTVTADCSGFVFEMFRRTDTAIPKSLDRARPNTVAWHRAIVQEEAFTRIQKVWDIQPGDVAVWQYREGSRPPGHMLLVDSVPVKVKPRKPLVPGLDQYEFAVIESALGPKSRDDTRYVGVEPTFEEGETQTGSVSSAKKAGHGGVGRGRMRFYADAEGNILGAAINIGAAKFHGQGDWNIVIGRPLSNAN